jgi:cellulose synthase (UDP-forming)
MFSEAWNLIALCAVLGLGAWGLSTLSPQDPGNRRMVCWGVMVANGFYLLWRYTFTLPLSGAPETWLAWTYLVIETLALLESGVFWLSLSRTLERTPPPLAALALTTDKEPSVEIWIPTYREPFEVLEKSVLAAKAVDYPGLRVKVLDDGNRAWLQERCQVWQVDYVTRPEHTHAKAGNLNHSLALTTADFIVTMDADFAAHRDFVRATLPFFADPRLAVLQTPQTFYNPDMVQQNLGLGGGVADEQALFFREIQPARDAWGCAFYCGSCAMLRTAALRDIGGFPSESITEDQLTTLKLLASGWTTQFLNRQLSVGLAAESIDAFFIQRDRWCKGAIEIMFLADGPLHNPRLTLMQRLLYMPFYWLINPFFTLAMMLAPVICLLTGLSIMRIEQTSDLYMLVMPTVVVNLFSLTWISRGRFSPIISSSLSMVMAVRMARSAVAGMLRRSSTVFKVTPKGSQISASSDRLIFRTILSLTLLTLVAIVSAGWVNQQAGAADLAMPWLVFLGVFNLLHFLVALVLVKDRPRLRSEERFQIDATLNVSSYDPQDIRHPAVPFQVHPVQVVDMSANGLKFVWRSPLQIPARLSLDIAGVAIGLRLQRQTLQEDGVLAVAHILAESPAQREALIQFLFSGRFEPVVQSKPGWIGALKQTALAVLSAS